MTDIIRTAANTLKATVDKEDFTTFGLRATKETDYDYDFFIQSITSYINVLHNIVNNLNEEKLKYKGVIPNCTVHRCDFCKFPCKDKRQEGRICGCFTYPNNNNRQLYVVK